MKIRLLESITLRCESLAAGNEIELADFDARQLIAAGHAEAVQEQQKPSAKSK